MMRPVLTIWTLAIALGVSAAALAASEAAAQEPPTPRDDGVEEIFVEGLRLPALAGETGSSVSVITAQDIELRSYQFALDAIAAAPGVTVNQNGAFGGLATVRIRGAATDQTLVLIDGVPFGDPTAVGGGYDFSILDVADIERIEILRGPHSTLWGSDAIGGVVNIITKRGTEPFAARGFVEGGSFATLRGGASISGADAQRDFRLSASGLRTNGVSKADADNGNSERDRFNSYAFAGAGGVDIGAVRLEARARYQSGETQIDGFPPPNFALLDTDDKSSTDQYAVLGRAMIDLADGALNNQASIGYTNITRRGAFGGFASQDDGDRLVLRYQGTAQLAARARLAFGAEREENVANGAETSINALFALAEIKPLAALTVSGGVRYDDHSRFGDVVTARVGAALALADWATLRASWGEGFKAPTIFQLTQSFGALPPNGDLVPETSSAYDVGLRLAAPGGGARLDIAYFNRDTDNLIIFAPNFRYENLDRTQAQGVEVTADWAFAEQFGVSAAYAYIDAKDVDSGLRQIRTPRHAGDAALYYRGPRAALAVSVIYNGDETDGAFGPDVDRWVRVDLSGAYTLSDKIELYGRVENFLDADYQQVSGYGTPGLSVYGGVRLAL